MGLGFDFQLPNYPITKLSNSQREQEYLHRSENKILVIACIRA